MKGRALLPGGTIGVAAPASPWDERSDIDRGVRWWESQGYRVKLAEGIWDRDDYVAGDPKVRARDLVAMFADPEVDVVQALEGGYGSSQVVPLVDLDAIAEHPKAFVGYSDITALHVAIRQRTGLVTLYGPGLAGVAAKETTDFTRERLLRALTDPSPVGLIPARPDDPYVGSLGGGTATARLVGGCLWLLRETLATPWELDVAGKILFFEDLHSPPFYVDATLQQLTNAGKLQDVAAVVIGEMFECEDWRFPSPWTRGRSMEDVFEYHLAPLGVPVLFNLPLGHGKHLCTVPLGVTATVDADARTLTIDEPALEPAKGGTT
jgi:muramoyltetrapeptide carboxypeptidase